MARAKRTTSKNKNVAVRKVKGKVTRHNPKGNRKKKGEVSAAKESTNPASYFYGGVLEALEKTHHVFSNTVKYLDPMSSGVLVIDRILGGGLRNSFISVAGPEASGKTTQLMHQLASAQLNNIPFTLMFDAEGTLNPEYAENVFNIYGLSYQELVGGKKSSFRYYRTNVIETSFDLIHGILKKMPDKMWMPDDKTWAYAIPKRDKYFASLMDKMNLTPSKALSTDALYICPTENSSLEGVVLIDSFAAMVTRSNDEADTKSKIRAAEASGFSDNLKRISSNISAKGILLSGVNQLRTVPGVTYGDPEYEPGGGALKFYTSQRMRMRHRSSGMRTDTITKDKDTSQMVEQSVHKEGYVDYYKYKFIKNTKNKISFPNLSGWVRVWVKDAFGNVRGIDPVFDVMEYLRDTGQISVIGRKKGVGNIFKFKLKDSIGKKRAELLNGLKPFSYPSFKGLILAETDGMTNLFDAISRETKTDVKYFKATKLRESLFAQIKWDRSVLETVKPSRQETDETDDVEEV